MSILRFLKKDCRSSREILVKIEDFDGSGWVSNPFNSSSPRLAALQTLSDEQNPQSSATIKLSGLGFAFSQLLNPTLL